MTYQQQAIWQQTFLNLPIETVVLHQRAFKSQLDIGENAFRILKVRKFVENAWDVGGMAATGAAVASSATVASTFFPAGGILGALGLGAAVTPVGWVIAAGVLSGAGWLAVRTYLSSLTVNRVEFIPKYLNTPLDHLAIAIFDLLAPLSIKIMAADGSVASSERDLVYEYFTVKWGFHPQFVSEGLKFHMHGQPEVDVELLASDLAYLAKSNPDCNYKSMVDNVLSFLTELAEADGVLHVSEAREIDKIRSILKNSLVPLDTFQLKKP